MNDNEQLTLRDQLYNIRVSKDIPRKQYVESQYENLQAHVIGLLKKAANDNYSCKISIGELYVLNYYKNEGHRNIRTELGEIFCNAMCNTTPSYPTADELQHLTTKLKTYLESQNLNVTYMSHCCLNISWIKNNI